jgi:hypothetical protein
MTSPTEAGAARPHPRAFISYAWDTPEHQAWVRTLAARLRADGVNVTLDQWALRPGDQLPHFMEESVRENDYIFVICTPRYAERSNNRQGGVGYEGDIMTATLMNDRNQRKFIPILRSGTPDNSIPTWLQGKYRVNLTGDPYNDDQYHDLLTTIHGLRPTPPPIGPAPTLPQRTPTPTTANRTATPAPTTSSGTQTAGHNTATPATPTRAIPEPIRILGIIADDVTTPRRDGTRGSALYTIPFQLSARPDHTWSTMFIEHWNHPPRWTTMHRPGIGRISGDRIILDGTTIEEVEQYHRDTLKLAIQETNREYDEHQQRENAKRERERQQREQHEQNIRDRTKRINFD